MEKQYDFKNIVERRNTNSLKYDFSEERGKPKDVLPMWVADMDFRTPDEVIDALLKRVRHGIFGYSEAKDDYFYTLQTWMKEHHGWNVKKEWLIKTPGVVFALAMAVRALTNEGDAVLIQQPVYYPFSEVIKDNGRKVISNTLTLRNEKYTIDFDDFEKKIIGNKIKLFLLCSPHNPVGRVWNTEELEKIGNICRKYEVTVVSDEIHEDFVYPGHKHHVFAGIKEEFQDIAITCTSPSKTFNLAGLQVSNIFIANRELRQRIENEINKAGYGQLNTLGLTACEAAYRYGGVWYSQLLEYITGNLNYLRAFLKAELPQIQLIEPDGTYLIWLDFRKLGLTEPQRERLLLNKAGLWLDSGAIFGTAGEGFERINIACPRQILKEALSRLKHAIEAENI